MFRKIDVLKSCLFTASIFLMVAGCENEQVEDDSAVSATVQVQIAEQAPVSGWLEVGLPSEPIIMDSFGNDLWILTVDGYLMKWNNELQEWSAVETDNPLFASDPAFSLSASNGVVALLNKSALFTFRENQVVEFVFTQDVEPLSICAVDDEFAVLFADGSVSLTSGSDLNQIVSSVGKAVVGSFCTDSENLAWLNQDGTLSLFNISESFLSEISVPDSTVEINLAESLILAGDGVCISSYNGIDGWDSYTQGRATGDNLVYTLDGIKEFNDPNSLTAGLPMCPVKTCILSDGSIWSLSDGGLTVWAEIGSIETRIPDADIQMIRYRMAGQTGSSTSGEGIETSDISFGGVFRIYESVSSRPDPFSEFPLASRDLRRSIEDLTIEELHLVGITLDASGGDQAMVEDANGVAYVLKEGTVLRNNTHIAEITGNEVIVVQEVTVGVEDGLGGTTSIPTIFSMRLHEEGGI